MKYWKIILATLLLTALYVVSVREALGGLRHLYRVEPAMVAPGEATMATVAVDPVGDGAVRVTMTPADTTRTLYYVLVKESFYDNLQDYKMRPAGLLLYGGEGVQKTDGPVSLDKTTRLAVFNHFNSYRETLRRGQTYLMILGRPDGEGRFSNKGEAECIRLNIEH